MKTILALLLIAVLADSSFYNLSTQTAAGGTVNLSQYKGKKVLIVNGASGSKFSKQYESLQQLYTKYKDSLSVIVFPSNSFGNEPLDNAAISAAMQASGCTYTVAAKTDVTGTGLHAVYGWLGDRAQNTRIGVTTSEDFKKILLDKNGMIIGIFGAPLDPMDSLIQKSILAPAR